MHNDMVGAGVSHRRVDDHRRAHGRRAGAGRAPRVAAAPDDEQATQVRNEHGRADGARGEVRALERSVRSGSAVSPRAARGQAGAWGVVGRYATLAASATRAVTASRTSTASS